MTNRLDAFTDAAFAFAVTLLVIGGSEAPTSVAMLMAAMAEVPAFAIGFAIIAMFWFCPCPLARIIAARATGSSMVLSVLLIFLVLIYVQPLRAMARSFSTFLGGSGHAVRGRGRRSLLRLRPRLRRDGGDHRLPVPGGAAQPATIDEEARVSVRGETIIWLILVATGLVSILLTSFAATAQFRAARLCDPAGQHRPVHLAL